MLAVHHHSWKFNVIYRARKMRRGCKAHFHHLALRTVCRILLAVESVAFFVRQIINIGKFATKEVDEDNRCKIAPAAEVPLCFRSRASFRAEDTHGWPMGYRGSFSIARSAHSKCNIVVRDDEITDASSSIRIFGSAKTC